MEKFKQLLFSENGIKIVNMLFFLAFLAHNLVFLVVAYLVWILFLAFCIKKAASRTSRIIYGCLLLLLLLWSCLMLCRCCWGYNSAGVRLFAAQTV